MANKIHFFEEGVDLKLSASFYEMSKKWVLNAIESEGKKVGEVTVVFCSKTYLIEMNKKYLSHDYHTDIITFNYNEGSIISGDLFLGTETIQENAGEMQISFVKELNRVIIHGVLHLIGYNDKTTEQAKEIRAKEDFYLTLYPGNQI